MQPLAVGERKPLDPSVLKGSIQSLDRDGHIAGAQILDALESSYGAFVGEQHL